MIKQLIANGKASYDNFELYIKERNPSMPKRRKNNKTVPGMHGSYDFSLLYGEAIYDDREIEYKFDITGWDIEDLDKERRKVFDWIMNITNTKIYDEYMPGYYWYGSYSDGSWSEDAEQGLLTVKFLVYPFAIAINPIERKFSLLNSEEKEIRIYSESSHKVIPKIYTTGNITIKKGNSRISLSEGEWELDDFTLERGENIFLVSGNADVCISYIEEVL